MPRRLYLRVAGKPIVQNNTSYSPAFEDGESWRIAGAFCGIGKRTELPPGVGRRQAPDVRGQGGMLWILPERHCVFFAPQF